MAANLSLAAVAPNLASPGEAAPAPLANGAFLFEMIVADLHWTGLQIAALSMMASACAAPGAAFSLHSCRHLAYDDTRVMQLALRYGEDAGLPLELRRKLDRLYADLSEIQKQIAPFVAAASLSATQRAQLPRIAPGLRKLALAAAEALGALEAPARGRLDGNYAEDSQTIRQFLARAARGDTGEIDRFGVLTTPRLKQRRQSPRAPVDRPCRLLTGKGEFEARLVDVSREGLGLACAAALAAGDAVAVMVGARRLEATVVRRQGEHVGLTLRRPLAFTDPLFRAA